MTNKKWRRPWRIMPTTLLSPEKLTKCQLVESLMKRSKRSKSSLLEILTVGMVAKVDKLAYLPILPRLPNCQGCQLCQGCQTANLSRACPPPSSWGLQVPQHVHQGGALFCHHPFQTWSRSWLKSAARTSSSPSRSELVNLIAHQERHQEQWRHCCCCREC